MIDEFFEFGLPSLPAAEEFIRDRDVRRCRLPDFGQALSADVTLALASLFLNAFFLIFLRERGVCDICGRLRIVTINPQTVTVSLLPTSVSFPPPLSLFVTLCHADVRRRALR